MSARHPKFDAIQSRLSTAYKTAGGIYAVRAREDAGFVAAVSRALEQFLTREFEVPLEELPLIGGSVIDIDESIDEGARTFAYQVLDGAGVAEFYDDYAQSSMPMVSVSNEEFVRPTATIALGYEFSQEDLMAERMAARNGRPMRLKDRLSKTTVRGMMEKHENVGMFGDVSRDLHGFANGPGVAQIAPLVDSSGSSDWSIKFGDTIIQDITNMFQAIRNNTVCTSTPNSLALPEATLTSLNRDYVSDGSTVVGSQSIIDRIRQFFPNLAIGSLCRLQSNMSQGNLDRSRAVMYNNSKDSVQYILPMRPRFFDPQVIELMTKVPGMSKLGGCQWWEPFTAVYADVDE
jgi:hypothetical protein